MCSMLTAACRASSLLWRVLSCKDGFAYDAQQRNADGCIGQSDTRVEQGIHPIVPFIAIVTSLRHDKVSVAQPLCTQARTSDLARFIAQGFVGEFITTGCFVQHQSICREFAQLIL
jgi:hypothetical protein